MIVKSVGRASPVALCLALAIVASPGPSRAQTAPTPAAPTTQAAPQPGPMTAEQKAAEVKSAWSDAQKVATLGPNDVKLLDQADLKLPDNTAFVPALQAKRILRAYGNTPGADVVGLVTGTAEKDDWLVVVRYIKEGYIKDDDAKDWNADDLLANIKEGTAQSNEDRAARGFPKLRIVGWIEKPTYDAQTHRLVWSLSSKQENEPDSADGGVNYNTYALGRDGYFSLNLLTSQSEVEAKKPVAHTLLSNLTYVDGKRYSDVNMSTDRIAAYGLAALVGGVAVKKLGLFAIAAAFLLKFAKIGIIAVIGLGAGISRLFKRKPKTDSQVAASSAHDPS
ncbi:DUF2167 domain-containing protein [Methylobacterium brachythecii]|uniref:Membrane protein n=1 Tax=Methylobacterium brachythecii TaxID=1176177 RepID=A0A7W6F703_9HYPH|nr:DUF2167 domain-containing protein [Methylobacterium brachythecii]MBB3902884.1 putative membrane-anchored protein [Methylobacterium brachythecii]GLS43811.1 membrane protein [Methylobacterium brachythecii]